MTDTDLLLYFPEGLELSRLEQRFAHHGPGQRPLGDCYRTALACLLGASRPDWVPHFVDLAEDLPSVDKDFLGWEARRLARQWLRAELELDLFNFELDVASETGRPFLASVESRRGPWGHVIVAQGTEVVHDPTGRLLAEAGLDPYTWDDVLAKDGSGDLLVLPYEPAPDEQLAQWQAAS